MGVDDASRLPAYRRFQEIAASELPMIFTVQRTPIVGVRSRVRNFRPSPAGVFRRLPEVEVVDG